MFVMGTGELKEDRLGLPPVDRGHCCGLNASAMVTVERGHKAPPSEMDQSQYCGNGGLTTRRWVCIPEALHPRGSATC
jgi:hypothetical protein